MDLRDAVDGATKAADESNLSQGEGGPADAYRHLLIVGEPKRRFGPLFGEALATTYEFMNDLGGQSELNRRMDDVNNEAALDGPDLRTFEDLQRWARGKISEAAPFDGDGLEGRVMWHRKPARNWRPDWSNVPLLSIERGGAEHQWGPEPGSGIPGVSARVFCYLRVPIRSTRASYWSASDSEPVPDATGPRTSTLPTHDPSQVGNRRRAATLPP